MRAPGNGDPDSAWPLRRKPVNHRLVVPGALGLGSSSNLTLCSPSFKFFFLSFPLTPPFPPKLSPKSRLSPLNILNPLLSVSLFCIQGGAVRSWRQPRPLALGAELAEDLGIFQHLPSMDSYRTLGQPGSARVAVLGLPDRNEQGSLSKELGFFLLFISQPHPCNFNLYRIVSINLAERWPIKSYLDTL